MCRTIADRNDQTAVFLRGGNGWLNFNECNNLANLKVSIIYNNCRASEAYRLKQELDSAREREKDARGRLMEITQQSVLHDKADILSYIGKEESLSTDKQNEELVQKFESAR